MKTFKQFILEQIILLENRIAFIKSQFPGKEDLVDRVAANADPTPNKKYTQWIMKQHEQGVNPDDHGRIRDILGHFNKSAIRRRMKESGDSINLNDHTLSSLERAIGPHIGAQSGKQRKKEIKSKGSDLIHNDAKLGVTVHHLKTKEAACSYGAGTKWCTAGENNNQFDNYNKKGPIYVIQHQGRKYQFHTATKQFVDEQDRNVKFKDLHSDIEKSLSTSEHPEIASTLVFHNSKYAGSKHVDAIIKHSNSESVFELFKNNPDKIEPHHIDMAMQHKDGNVAKTVLTSHSDMIQPHHIDMAMNILMNDATNNN